MNIYQIQEEILSVYAEIEANDGEITPELEEKLAISQDEFKDKVKDYTSLIKHLEANMKECTEETKRLKEYYEKKEKLRDNLKKVVIKAINDFGDTKKSGVKYIDYGTGEVSVRKSTAVDVNEGLVDFIQSQISNTITFQKQINQLDTFNCIDKDSIMNEQDKELFIINDDELDKINVTLQVTVPFKDLRTGSGYPVIKEIAKYSDNYKLSAGVSKTELKPELQENGSCLPNLAHLQINESLTIK